MATLRDARILHSRHHHHEEEKHAMDYDAYRDDQVNTGVIAALIGGFALGNIWEQELESNVDVRNPLSPTTSLVKKSLILQGIACARRARRADKMPAASALSARFFPSTFFLC